MNHTSGTQRGLAWPARFPVVADCVAALVGAALVLAFAPFAWRPLAVLSPAVLLWLWLHSSPARALWRGYLFGLAFFGFGVSWVFNSIHVFGEAPAALAALITASLVLVMALYPALTGYLVNRHIKAPVAISLLLAYPAMWTLLEWTRGWLFTGFPWLTLGQAQLDWPLAGLIPLLGANGAGWACMLTAGALVYSFVACGPRRWVAVACIVCLWLTAAWLDTLSWTKPYGRPLTVSLIQGNVAQDEKMSSDSRQPTLKLYRRLTRAHWADLIVWPETAIPTWYDHVAKSFIEPLAREARRNDAELVTGVFVFDPRVSRAYNAVARLGEPPGFYFKRHLVPFGEYMPLRGWLEWMEGMLVIPMSDLSSGNGRPLLHLPRLDNMAVGISICYEAAYGAEVNDALPEAGLLINVSNDAWFGDSLAPHQHLEIARLRAVETGRFLLRATNTGISAVIDAQGEIMARSSQFETQALTAKAQPRRGMTPFSRWESWPLILLSLLCVLAALVLMRARPDNAHTNTS